MYYITRFFALTFLLLTICLNARADTVTFEAIPGGMPVDGMMIDNQFQADFGVTFSLEGGGAPILAQVGGPLTAFQGFNGLPDTPAPGTNTGSFFLTDDADLDRPDQALIIDYATAVSAASGVILDIDQAEAWQVQALDMSGTLLESIDLGPNLLLDGSATPWVFDRNLSDIQQIRIEYTGTTNGNVGLAFDNFSPSSAILFVPEPSSTVLFIASAMAAVVCRRKRLA